MTDNLKLQKCIKGGKNPALTMKDLAANTPALAKKMGLGQKCTKAATTHSSTFSTSASAHLLFMGGSAQLSTTNLDNNMNESGCGSFFLNASNTLQGSQNIACSINNSSVSATTQAQIGQSVIIKALPISDAARASTLSTIAILQSSMNQSIILSEKYPQSTKSLIAGNTVLINNLEKTLSSDVNISGSTIKNTSATNIKTMTTNISGLTSSLSAHYKNIAQNTAEQHIKEALGTNAMDPNTKSAISNNTTINNDNVSKNIQTALNKNKVSVNSAQQILIESVGGDVNLTNTVIDNDIAITLATRAVTQSAFQSGMKTASDVLTKAMTSTTAELKSAGLDELQKQLGKTNAEAIAASGKAGKGGIMGIIMVVVIGGLLLKYGKKILPPIPPFAIFNKKVFIMWLIALIVIIVVFILIWHYVASKLSSLIGMSKLLG